MVKIETIIELKKGKKPNSISLLSENGALPYVDIKAFEKGIIEAYTNDDKCISCEDGDLLIVCDGSRSGLVGRAIKGYVGSTLARIDIDSSADKDYIYYFIQGKYALLNTQKKGTGTPHLNAALLKESRIFLPDISTQRRIVAKIEELFSQLDSGVETLKKTKAQLAVYRQAVLKEAFSPMENWEHKRLSEIGVVNLGRQRSPKNVSNNYPTKYIRAANITETGLSLTDVLDMEFTPKEKEKYLLKHGDIVVSEASGSITQVGKPAIWEEQLSECCFQNTVIRLRLKNDNPKYVYWYLKYLYVNGYYSRIVGGVGINHIGAGNFSNIEIDLAPISEQDKIVNQIESRLSVCDSIEKIVDEALQQAEGLRQSILKKAFEGEM